MPIMRPSTWAGTPEIICCGGGPRRSGQAARTASWSPPMPPEVTTTLGAPRLNVSTAVRELDSPRATSEGSRTVPDTPVTAPAVTSSASTRWRKRIVTRPSSTACCTRRRNGSRMPGPVPQTMWKRGTELPWPVAEAPPRSAQPTTGKKRTPIAWSHGRFSPAAHST